MFAASGLRSVAPQTTQGIPYPAPSRGVNAADNLAEMQPQDAIFSYNMLPQAYGLKVRTGYREFATDVGTDGGRTVMPFNGSTSAQDKLFACAEDGIYEISAGGAGPWVADETFPDQDATSGYGQFAALSNSAGHFLLYCDETNGYYVYDEGGPTWTKVAMGGGATEVDNVDPTEFVSVCVHKGRAWFVQKDSAIAWYLDPDSIFGAATAFNFGSRFKKGGFLVNLFTWTIDGGEGVDDYLVAVSSSGDVVMFRGTDPDDATAWFMRGVWDIGRPPAGRRCAGSFGGELYLLSSYGILPASKLISGVLIQEQSAYLSRRIAPLVHARMAQTADTLGWEIVSIPNENLLFVGIPQFTDGTHVQFAYSLNIQGWGLYRDFPYFTGNEWDGSFYFSEADSVIYIHEGDLDAVSLDGTTFESISFSLLTSFQALDPSEHFKRGQFIRPYFLAGGVPSYEVRAAYDYDLAEGTGLITPATQVGTLWDVGEWDVAFWSGGTVVSMNPDGATGIGTTVAIGLRGETTFPTTLIKFSMMADAGGLL